VLARQGGRVWLCYRVAERPQQADLAVQQGQDGDLRHRAGDDKRRPQAEG
jgi:hypothetical protein